MIKNVKKGNVLLITSILLLAIVIVAGGLSAYFIRNHYVSKNVNNITQIKLQLENKVNKTYTLILKNENSEQSIIEGLNNNEFTLINETKVIKNETDIYTISVSDSKYELNTKLLYVNSTYILGERSYQINDVL